LIFKNQQDEIVHMETSVCAIVSKGFVFKFKHQEQNQETESRCKRLEHKIARLEKLEAVYNETNEIARIGGWDVDLISNEIIWTNVTYDIHEVPRDYIPDLASGISFYKEGFSRDLVTKLFGEAIEKAFPLTMSLNWSPQSKMRYGFALLVNQNLKTANAFVSMELFKI